MPRKQPPLRAVQADERPPVRKPKTITVAAREGTTLELLEALRDRIATATEDPNCPARELASLSRRLHELTKDIAAIKSAAKDEDGAASTDDESFDAQAL